VQHAYDGSTMNAGTFDESFRTVPRMAPGDALLFHPRLAHGSGTNPSEQPRRLVTLWFGGGAAPSATEPTHTTAPRQRPRD
jgi:ectoine hydroxylase-related dioxygenase (phytanoyl-CoA dioxygenase family)